MGTVFVLVVMIRSYTVPEYLYFTTKEQCQIAEKQVEKAFSGAARHNIVCIEGVIPKNYGRKY